MTVFKAFLSILKKNKFILLLYTAILVFFGTFNFQNNNSSVFFEAEKPDIYIVNEDRNEGITKALIAYLEKNCRLVSLENKDTSINDALFYRDVNYIIYIPKNFREDFLNQKNPQIEIKSTKDYPATLANLYLERFLKVASVFRNMDNEEEMISHIENSLFLDTSIRLVGNLDTSSLEKVAGFYNFLNYSLLAGCVYVICVVLSSFKKTGILKRNMVSSMNYKRLNRLLLLSNGLFALFMWFIYFLLAFILLGNILFTPQGLMYILNSFIFSFCALTIAFFIGNLIYDKNAINGIVNVVALGSSFLCGAFVPLEYLPDGVIKLAHILPSYYFIKTNELLKKLEVFSFVHLKPIIINMVVIVLFSFIFVLLTNVISKRKRVIA